VTSPKQAWNHSRKKLLTAEKAKVAKKLGNETKVSVPTATFHFLKRALERDDSLISEMLVFPLPNISAAGPDPLPTASQ